MDQGHSNLKFKTTLAFLASYPDSLEPLIFVPFIILSSLFVVRYLLSSSSFTWRETLAVKE
jgi:hypothetical protein